MTKTAVIAMIVFGCSLRVLAEDAAATAAAAAGGAMNAAAADGHISTIKFIHSKNTAASWKPEGQDEQSHPVDRGYTMYGQISAHFPANRLCRFRFEPMDYLTVMHSDHLLKMWHYGIDGAPADPNARWSVPTILALPVPPTPFSWIWFRSGNTPLPELHSLAEFNDATTSAWFVNPAEKSDAKLYVKMYDGLLIKLEDPYVDSVVNLHAPVEGETVSGIIDGIAQVDALRYQHVGFFVDGVSVGSPHLLMADPPYGWRIDTTKLSDGPHVIEARSHEPGLPGAYRSSGKINIKVDNSKPAVSLLQFQWIDDRNGPRGFTPWPWSSIGGPVPVKAAVANMKAVGKVEFLMDSTVMETDTSDPYEATIDSTKFKDGPHEMTVKAYDAAGNPAASQTKKVFVLNHFTIKVMTPSAGETVSGTVTATASTSEGYRCRYLKFLVDGVCMGEDNDLRHEPPFGVSIDTTKLADGPHELVVERGWGNMGADWMTTYNHITHLISSEKVPFKVDNTRPAVFLQHTARFDPVWPGRKLRGSVPVEAGVANLKAVGKVEFYIDATLCGADASNPVAKREAELARLKAEFEAAKREYEKPRPEEEAKWEQDLIGLGPWWVLGPYQEASAAEAYKKDYGPEQAVDLTKPTADGKVWVQHEEYQEAEETKLAGENCATYVYRVITAGAKTTLPLVLGRDDNCRVWVNGQQAVADEVTTVKGMWQDPIKLDIELRAGANALLMKIVNSDKVYGFSFTAPLGTRISAAMEPLLALPAAQRSPAQREQVAAYCRLKQASMAGAREQLTELEGRVVARESDPRCPYRASLDTTKFKDGEYALTVKAYDAAGNLAASQTTKVVVDNKPVITILTPRSRQTVSGTFIAKADLSGVLPEGSSRSVKFLIDGVVRGEDSLVKHEPPLAVAIDSTKLSNGAHELVAQSGLHDKGQISSEKVAFRVDNTNPAIFLVDKALVETPWAGIRLKGTAPIEVGVANMEKIIKMELWVDGALMKSNSVYDPNPYAFSLDTTKLTNGAHLITLKAYAGQGWLTALQNTKVVVANAVEGGAK